MNGLGIKADATGARVMRKVVPKSVRSRAMRRVAVSMGISSLMSMSRASSAVVRRRLRRGV